MSEPKEYKINDDAVSWIELIETAKQHGEFAGDILSTSRAATILRQAGFEVTLNTGEEL